MIHSLGFAHRNSSCAAEKGSKFILSYNDISMLHIINRKARIVQNKSIKFVISYSAFT